MHILLHKETEESKTVHVYIYILNEHQHLHEVVNVVSRRKPARYTKLSSVSSRLDFEKTLALNQYREIYT